MKRSLFKLEVNGKVSITFKKTKNNFEKLIDTINYLHSTGKKYNIKIAS